MAEAIHTTRRGFMGHILGAAAASSAVTAVVITAPRTPTRQDIIAYADYLWAELRALEQETGITTQDVVTDLSGIRQRVEVARSRGRPSQRAVEMMAALNI